MKVQSKQNFMVKKQLKKSYCICLSVIIIDSGLKNGYIYYPHVILKECKYND